MSPTPLIPEQRQERVLSALRREGVVSIRALASDLGVSHMTIRRDLAQMETAGQVSRVKGGVRLVGDGGGHNAPLDRGSRSELEPEKKRSIAQAAARHVEPDSVVFLDAGTTTQAIVPFLSGMDSLTVVTNDFLIVNALFAFPRITVLHTGGNVDGSAGCAEGPSAVRFVRDLNVDTYFVSTAGWSLARGVSAPSADKAALKLEALEVAARSILVADSTKYGASAMMRVFGLDDLDLVITDRGLAEEQQKRLTEAGVEVELA